MTDAAELLSMSARPSCAEAAAVGCHIPDWLMRLEDEFGDTAAIQFIEAFGGKEITVPIEAVKDLMNERRTAANTLNERDIEHRVTLALNEGSITPGMREWATALCQSDPDSFDEFLTSTGAPYAHLFQPVDNTFAATSLNGMKSGPQTGDAANIAAQLGIDPKELN